MIEELTIPILTFALGLSIISGIHWTGYTGEAGENRLGQLLFRTKARSLVTAHLIFGSGLLLVSVIDSTLALLDILALGLSMELIFLLIGPQLFLNWHVGPFSQASRNKMQIRLLEAQESLEDNEVLVSQTVDSLIKETRSGNQASRKVMRDVLRRHDSVGEIILQNAITVDEELVREIQSEI